MIAGTPRPSFAYVTVTVPPTDPVWNTHTEVSADDSPLPLLLPLSSTLPLSLPLPLPLSLIASSVTGAKQRSVGARVGVLVGTALGGSDGAADVGGHALQWPGQDILVSGDAHVSNETTMSQPGGSGPPRHVGGGDVGWVGESVGDRVVGCAVVGARVTGARVGDKVVGGIDGETVGGALGDTVGDSEGDSDGDVVGDNVGEAVGEDVGDTVGLRVGDVVGLRVGDDVGMCVEMGFRHRVNPPCTIMKSECHVRFWPWWITNPSSCANEYRTSSEPDTVK